VQKSYQSLTKFRIVVQFFGNRAVKEVVIQCDEI
jgi:hypothetical protein